MIEHADDMVAFVARCKVPFHATFAKVFVRDTLRYSASDV